MSVWTPEKMAFRKKAPPKRKPRNKVFKQKRAYKPRQKKRFMRKRQPFVETKKAFDATYVQDVMNPLLLETQPNPQYRTFRNKQISPIDKFMFMERGVGNSKIIGRDIFSKYLKQKIEIILPAGVIPDTTIPAGNTNRPFCRITQPCQIWVVWGWIKKPFGSRLVNATGTPAVNVNDVLNEVDFLTSNGDALLGNVNTRGTTASDYLTFPDKRKKLWTMNKRLLRPSRTPTSVKPPDSYLSQDTQTSDPTPEAQQPQNTISDFGEFRHNGYPNKLQTTISWKTQRKMRFDLADPDSATAEGFARDSWIPYSYICIPKEFRDSVNRASPATYRYPVDMTQPATHTFYDLVGDMKCSANMCHWYSDS